MGYWTFEEESGTSASDSSGVGNTGTMYSSSTLTNLYTAASKVGGYAGSFDGVDDYTNISMTSDFSSSSSDRTITFWMKPEIVTGWGGIIGYGGGGTNGSFDISWKENEQKLSVERWGGTAAIWSSNVTMNAWNFVAITLSGGQSVAMYLGGNIDNTATYVDFNTIADKVRIGSHNKTWTPNSFFDGTIDEVRIYNRALSASEIKALYNATR